MKKTSRTIRLILGKTTQRMSVVRTTKKVNKEKDVKEIEEVKETTGAFYLGQFRLRPTSFST